MTEKEIIIDFIIGSIKIKYLLIIAIPLYLLLKFILKKYMRKSNKSVKILTIVFTIIGSPIIFISSGIIFVSLGMAYIYILNPTISLEPLDKPIDPEIVSAKQIVEYLNNEIQQIDKFTKYDLTVGEVDMHLDAEHRGQVTVTFVEKENENTKVIFADLDTRRSIFHRFSDQGRESKLNPGIIYIQNWKIDSKDAVRIAEDYISARENFRYDEIWLISVSYYRGNKEVWDVYLTNNNNDIRYNLTIDPYSGEVLK